MLSVGFRGLLTEAAAVAASAARLLGRRHEARRVAFVGLRPCAARPPVSRVRLRPASRSLPVWVGLAASGRNASSLVLRASRRRPIFRAPGLHKEAEASRGLWCVVLVVAVVLRAPASPSARPRLVLGRVVRGGPRRFIPEALAAWQGPRQRPFRSSWPLSRPLLFSARETALCFAAPGSLGESRARQSAVQPDLRLGTRNGIS